MEILFAFVMGLMFSIVFLTVFKVKGPPGFFWIFLLVVFLSTLISVRFVRPAGPPFVGVYWVAGLITAVLVSLLLAAVFSGFQGAGHHKKRGRPTKEINTGNVKEARLGVYFWLIIIILTLLAMAGFFHY
ncbi:MAG: hypothetical protein ACK4ND_05190 [Cytophagaceae bacterium]